MTEKQKPNPLTSKNATQCQFSIGIKLVFFLSFPFHRLVAELKLNETQHFQSFTDRWGRIDISAKKTHNKFVLDLNSRHRFHFLCFEKLLSSRIHLIFT